MTRHGAATLSLISIIVLSGCTSGRQPSATAALFAQATPICTVLGNPGAYTGKRLLVRGNLALTPEGSDFLDSGCDRGFLVVKLSTETTTARQLRSQLGKYAAQSTRRPQQVPVVYSGTLIDHGLGFVCAGLCSQFTLEGAQLVAVRRD